MNYSLLRESRVVVVYNGGAFEFDALSDVSSSLAYEEYKSNRKTLHNKSNYALSFVTAQSPTSVSLSVNLTSNLLEAKFFEWLGMLRYQNTFELPSVSPVEPLYVDMYIIASDRTVVSVQTCFVSAIDFTLEKGVPLLNISVEGAYQTLLGQSPFTATLKQGSILPVSPLYVKNGADLLPGVQGAAISLQQQCSWREQRGVHDVGSVYHHSLATVSEMSVSATVNAYLIRKAAGTNLINVDTEYNTPITIYNKQLSLFMPKARITKRLEVQDLFTVGYDIIPMEGSAPVTLTLFGE